MQVSSRLRIAPWSVGAFPVEFGMGLGAARDPWIGALLSRENRMLGPQRLALIGLDTQEHRFPLESLSKVSIPCSGVDNTSVSAVVVLGEYWRQVHSDRQMLWFSDSLAIRERAASQESMTTISMRRSGVALWVKSIVENGVVGNSARASVAQQMHATMVEVVVTGGGNDDKTVR